MSNFSISTNELITIKQFEGGWIWVKNIEEFSSKFIDIYEKNMKKIDIEIVSNLLNCKIEYNWKLYDDTEWILIYEAFPEMYLIFVYNKNDEFGSELKIFFNKLFLKEIPTEDAYCFVELLLKSLTRIYETPEALKMKISGDIITIEELLDLTDPKNKEKLREEIIEIRSNILKQISKDIVKDISRKIKGEFISGKILNFDIDWGIKFNPFKEIEFIISLIKDKVEIFYSMSSVKFPARDVLFFTWLYCNAIIRESRKILGNKLPKLSKYL